MTNVSAYPAVIIVDENDREVGSVMLAEAWQKGLYHRIVSVFVTDEQGRLLLQLRGPDVKIYPNCWDQAAGGHVDEGSSYDEAAENELTEELGLRGIPLTALGTFRSNSTFDDGRIVNQFERVYATTVPHGAALKLQTDEVSKAQWFTPAELRTLIAAHPERFTPGLLYGLRTYFPAFKHV